MRRKKERRGITVDHTTTDHTQKEEKEKVVNGVKERFRGLKNKASNIAASS